MNVQKLEEQLNAAVEDYKRKVEDTCREIENEDCRTAVRNLSDDVGHCFADFASAVIGTMKQM